MITEREKIVATIVPAQERSKQVGETIMFLCFVGRMLLRRGKKIWGL
jgi:hypothetical protein